MPLGILDSLLTGGLTSESTSRADLLSAFLLFFVFVFFFFSAVLLVCPKNISNHSIRSNAVINLDRLTTSLFAIFGCLEVFFSSTSLSVSEDSDDEETAKDQP